MWPGVPTCASSSTHSSLARSIGPCAGVGGACTPGRQPIAHADAWIAATARLYGLPLVTNNARHYAGVAGSTIWASDQATWWVRPHPPPAPLSQSREREEGRRHGENMRRFGGVLTPLCGCGDASRAGFWRYGSIFLSSVARSFRFSRSAGAGRRSGRWRGRQVGARADRTRPGGRCRWRCFGCRHLRSGSWWCCRASVGWKLSQLTQGRRSVTVLWGGSSAVQKSSPPIRAGWAGRLKYCLVVPTAASRVATIIGRLPNYHASGWGVGQLVYM